MDGILHPGQELLIRLKLQDFNLNPWKNRPISMECYTIMKKKVIQTELVGTEEMEGTEVFKIKQTDEEGNEYYHFIDAENYVLLKMICTIKVDESEIEVETLYSNYKE